MMVGTPETQARTAAASGRSLAMLYDKRRSQGPGNMDWVLEAVRKARANLRKPLKANELRRLLVEMMQLG